MPWCVARVVALTDELLLPLDQEDEHIDVIFTGIGEVREDGLLTNKVLADCLNANRREFREPFWVAVNIGGPIKERNPRQVLDSVEDVMPERISKTADRQEVYLFHAMRVLISRRENTFPPPMWLR